MKHAGAIDEMICSLILLVVVVFIWASEYAQKPSIEIFQSHLDKETGSETFLLKAPLLVVANPQMECSCACHYGDSKRTVSCVGEEQTECYCSCRLPLGAGDWDSKTNIERCFSKKEMEEMRSHAKEE